MGALVADRRDPHRGQFGPQIQSEEQQEQSPGHEAPKHNRCELGLCTGVGKYRVQRQMSHDPKRDKRESVHERECRHAP